MTSRPLLRLVHLARSVSIKEQLWIEEALLRHDSHNWCLMKEGEEPGTAPTIVMGIGGRPEKLVHIERTKRDGVSLLRRFSGGGTVVVDEDSLFVTFIMNVADTTPKEPYPRPIMEWTAQVYQPVFDRLQGPKKALQTIPFSLRENDYVFGQAKFGGNAQCIIKDRWLHHTSFLWDFRDERMSYLTLPDKRPMYRENRDHTTFLTRLRHQVATLDRTALLKETARELHGRFEVEVVPEEEARSVLQKLGGLTAWSAKARTASVTLEAEG